MRNGWYLMGLAWLMAACSGAPQGGAEGVCTVDVAGAMENHVELKMSELGKSVRYIPLETNDSCLVGRNPRLQVLDNHLLVYVNKECMVFDKEGKFLNRVGHVGDDPEGYSSAVPTYNDVDGSLYFKRRPATLQRYGLQGDYLGKVTVPTPPDSPSDYAFTDSLIIGYYANILGGENLRSLLFFNEAGELLDTVPSLLPDTPGKSHTDIASFNIRHAGISFFSIVDYKDGSRSSFIGYDFPLWKSNGQVRLNEAFCDTIYTVKRDGLEPYIVFQLGKWHWGADARMSSDAHESRLVLSTVFETPSVIFFQCVRSLYAEDPVAINGVYDRATGTTRMNLEEKGFADDLTGFMPFHPQAYSARGEFAAILDAGKVLAWLEEHPDATRNEQLARLAAELDEEANPVVVLTVPE